MQPLWKMTYSLKKLKTDLPFDPGIPLLGIYSKDPEKLIQKYMQSYVYSNAIYSSQDVETA